MKKSTKLALLALTSFILSGVLAWVGGETTNAGLEEWCVFVSIVLGFSALFVGLYTLVDAV